MSDCASIFVVYLEVMEGIESSCQSNQLLGDLLYETDIEIRILILLVEVAEVTPVRPLKSKAISISGLVQVLYDMLT